MQTKHSDTTSAISYVPELDAVRAVAILLVIIGHWIPNRYSDLMGFGGVTLFFVLSGYLITSILIQYKSKVDSGQQSKWWYFKTFFIRRTLRIFPIYYLYLFILFALGFTMLLEGMNYFLLYAGNHFIYDVSNFPVLKSHLWSLAVEEQFYVIWPIAILLCPMRKLTTLLMSIAALAILFRIVFYLEPTPLFRYPLSYVLTPNCLDSFAIGGLISYVQAFQKGIYQKLVKYSNAIILIGIVAFVSYRYLSVDWLKILERLLGSILSAGLILYALKGFPGPLKKVLNNSLMRLIGKVSYGLYVYHLLVPFFCYLFIEELRKMGILPAFFSLGSPAEWYFDIIVLCLMTAFSWHFIEKPLNSLKRYFT